MEAGLIRRGATFSRCRRYRWNLSRWWDSGPWIGWVLLNPSTADARKDDPTIRRCIRFSQRWGYSGCMMCNLFALRSTSPHALYEHRRPVGRRNDAAILALTERCPIVVAAWGVHGAIGGRGDAVARMLRESGSSLFCLGRTRAGNPRHPLYLRRSQRLQAYM